MGWWMASSRGQRTGWKWLVNNLQVLYGQHLGELDRIENPPKSMQRKWRGRDAYNEGAATREARAQQIREALPHMAYVIKMLDPEWVEEAATVIRPKRAARPAPSIGWPEAVLRVLRDADDYLSVSNILDEIVAPHDDLDLSPVGARQDASIAVSGVLTKTYRHLLVHDEDRRRWALASLAPSFEP